MSPRAAWRLKTLGFERVYDYVGGKADWLAHGTLCTIAATCASNPAAPDLSVG
jgi:3-mercaptopyruvate sulfurtransferase SseA